MLLKQYRSLVWRLSESCFIIWFNMLKDYNYGEISYLFVIHITRHCWKRGEPSGTEVSGYCIIAISLSRSSLSYSIKMLTPNKLLEEVECFNWCYSSKIRCGIPWVQCTLTHEPEFGELIGCYMMGFSILWFIELGLENLQLSHGVPACDLSGQSSMWTSMWYHTISCCLEAVAEPGRHTLVAGRNKKQD